METILLVTGQNQTMLAILALGIAAMVFGLWAPDKRKRRSGRFPRDARSKLPMSLVPRPLYGSPDPAMQLKAVMLNDFRAKQVLSWTEAKVWHAAEATIGDLRLGWRVLGQVSLGEVLACEDHAGFNAINAKRVDLLIIDQKHMPLAAIEYQGSGHYLDGTAAARDAVKKEALRKAGIGYIEVTASDGPADLRSKIEQLARALTPAAVKVRNLP